MPYKDPEQNRIYRIAHKEERRIYDAVRVESYREKRHQLNVAYYAAHADEERAYSRAYGEAHKETRRAYNALWVRDNPEKMRANRKRHDALKRGAQVSDFTHAQWTDMQIAYDHRCVYCGKRAKSHLTQDHITPLSKGGNHTLVNIVPACRSCNSKKHAGPPLAPVQPLML